MIVQHFFHEPTWTLTYLVYDEASRVGIVIDSVRDFDLPSGRTSFRFAESMARVIDSLDLRILYALDTHAHADHLSGMPFFRERYGAQTAIGWRITEVQEVFRDVFNLGSEFPVDGRQFDLLMQDGQVLDLGAFHVEALHTPGHTPACMSYRVGDALFVGDTLFMPDSGTARCDFPSGSAAQLFESIQRLYRFPASTRVFVGHDYQPGGRRIRCETTIGEERSSNTQIRADTSKEAYVELREKRDATLDLPRLIVPSIQVNIRAGALPDPETNGVRYLRVPVDVL